MSIYVSRNFIRFQNRSFQQQVRTQNSFNLIEFSSYNISEGL